MKIKKNTLLLLGVFLVVGLFGAALSVNYASANDYGSGLGSSAIVRTLVQKEILEPPVAGIL